MTLYRLWLAMVNLCYLRATVDLVGKGDHSKGIATLEKLNNKGNKVYG